VRPEGSLRAVFARLIEATGPITVAHYMAESNARYYDSRDPLGTAGDFITAPEISQMFGELIGLWLADMWIRAGRPSPVHYVELGPGRATLARDALAAARRFGLEPKVHFVEASTALIALQRAVFPAAKWHGDLSTLPDEGCLLLVANELFDALPVRQLVRTRGGWRERMIGWDGSDLIALAGERPMDLAVPPLFADAPEGAILEASPAAASIAGEIARRLHAQGGAALVIDYGHARAQLGSTLQAVRAHARVDALAFPGEADLTAHVDFNALAQVAQAQGARWLGTTSQGTWLRAMGIGARAQALARAAPTQAQAIGAALERLAGEQQMGALFKVMALAAPAWPEGAGFEEPAAADPSV
jgi:NADH dehydrogenase [ubiquinone] 1 alpha subcomplex assembly factor 7